LTCSIPSCILSLVEGSVLIRPGVTLEVPAFDPDKCGIAQRAEQHLDKMKIGGSSPSPATRVRWAPPTRESSACAYSVGALSSFLRSDRGWWTRLAVRWKPGRQTSGVAQGGHGAFQAFDVGFDSPIPLQILGEDAHSVGHPAVTRRSASPVEVQTLISPPECGAYGTPNRPGAIWAEGFTSGRRYRQGRSLNPAQ
jgi:hypothetical protein